MTSMGSNHNQFRSQRRPQPRPLVKQRRRSQRRKLSQRMVNRRMKQLKPRLLHLLRRVAYIRNLLRVPKQLVQAMKQLKPPLRSRNLRNDVNPPSRDLSLPPQIDLTLPQIQSLLRKQLSLQGKSHSLTPPNVEMRLRLEKRFTRREIVENK